ncbi:hypothetical protein GCM10025793_15160 [Lysobacter lycopersici]
MVLTPAGLQTEPETVRYWLAVADLAIGVAAKPETATRQAKPAGRRTRMEKPPVVVDRLSE